MPMLVVRINRYMHQIVKNKQFISCLKKVHQIKFCKTVEQVLS